MRPWQCTSMKRIVHRGYYLGGAKLDLFSSDLQDRLIVFPKI